MVLLRPSPGRRRPYEVTKPITQRSAGMDHDERVNYSEWLLMWPVLMLALHVGTSGCSGADAAGKPCGGNIRNPPTCPAGYTCVPAQEGGPAFGDVGGVCRRNDPDGVTGAGGASGGAAAGGAAGAGGAA